MKKVLYYCAQAMLLLCSLMVGFVGSSQSVIFCYSSLLIGLFMMLFYCSSQKNSWAGFFLYGTVAFCHLFYLSVSSAYSSFCIGGMVTFMILSLVFLYMEFHRKKASLRDLLSFTLFEKAALIPEMLLNYLMAKSSGTEIFGYFNYVLLALTGIYAISCLVKMYQKQIVVQSWAIVLSLFQFFFFTDILSTAAMLIMVIRYKEPETPIKKPIYEKAAFSANKVHKRKKTS